MTKAPYSPPGVLAETASHDGIATEIYDGDDLPVLLRLPDLTGPAEPVIVPSPPVLEPSASVLEPLPDLEGDPVWEDACEPSIDESSVESLRQSHDLLPVSDCTAASESLEGLRQQRQRRRERAVRRNQLRASIPSWLRGLGQLMLAAVMAGLLFAILVSLRGARTTPPIHSQPIGARPPLVSPADKLPELDLGDARGDSSWLQGTGSVEHAPLPHDQWPETTDLPQLTAPELITEDAQSLETPDDPHRRLSSPSKWNAASSETVMQYPSTDQMEPVRAPTQDERRGWSGFVPGQPVRSAEILPYPQTVPQSR